MIASSSNPFDLRGRIALATGAVLLPSPDAASRITGQTCAANGDCSSSL